VLLVVEDVGEGSTQISPNHSFDLHVCVGSGSFRDVEEGKVGGVVIVDLAMVVLSLQPKKPGVIHVCVEVEAEERLVVGSLHPPKKPGK